MLVGDGLNNKREIKASLIEGPVNKLLIKLTIPMIWGLLSVIGFNLVDTFFVAKLGTDALAAISFTFPVVTFFGAMAVGLGTGCSSVIARAIGEGNSDKIKTLTLDSLILSIFIVLIFLIIGIFTIDPLFKMLGVNDKLLPMVREYMEIWYVGMFFVIIPMVGNSAIRASGDARIPGIIMVIAAVSNVILDPIFIFGFWFVPAMGLKGAAIATVIARGFTLFASLYVLKVMKGMLDFDHFRVSGIVTAWKEILKVSLPLAFSRSVIPISLSVITAIIADFGEFAVAAFGIATRIEAFALLVYMALAASIGPFVGQNWTANKKNRVKLAISKSFNFSIIFSILISIILAIFARQITQVFTNTEEVISYTSFYLYIVPISYSLESCRFIFTSFYNALGLPKRPTILNISKMFLLTIPLAILGSKLWGVIGIFIMISVVNIFVGLISLILTYKYFQEDKRV